MRVPLQRYLQGQGSRVFSLVVRVPFAPLDIDLGHLSRGEWNALVDRFRVWYIPGREGGSEPVCYVMVRKFEPRGGVLVFGHVVVNLANRKGEGDGWSFTVGVLSNDDVRARAVLNSMLDIPPSFHRRSELKIVEKRWRKDHDAVVRFLANVHSTAANSVLGPGGRVYRLKFEPPPEIMGELKRGMGPWWHD